LERTILGKHAKPEHGIGDEEMKAQLCAVSILQ
jgi:hypothetical protein